MTKEFYDKLAKPYEEDEKKRGRLLKVNSLITRLVYIVYPILLIVLLILRDGRFIKTLLVPLVTFAAVTIFRKLCNAKRPYEVWDVKPLIPKETKGNSFPSRHVFSIYIITMAAASSCIPLAILLAAAGVFLASARVVARVHFIKDVFAGAILAIGLGIVGFWIIPG